MWDLTKNYTKKNKVCQCSSANKKTEFPLFPWDKKLSDRSPWQFKDLRAIYRNNFV